MSKLQKTNLNQPVPLSHHIGPKYLGPERIFHVYVESMVFRQGLFLPVVTLMHLTVSNTDQTKETRNGERRSTSVRRRMQNAWIICRF